MIKKRDQKKLGNKGFSLVELIVVIAIMAILVGVLAPVLIRNIEKSRESKDLQALDSVKSAVTTALAREDCYKELVGTSETTYTFTLSSGDLSAPGKTLTNTNPELASILGSNGVKLSSTNLKDLTSITVKVASDGSVIVGAYQADGTTAYTGTVDTSIVFEVK